MGENPATNIGDPRLGGEDATAMGDHPGLGANALMPGAIRREKFTLVSIVV